MSLITKSYNDNYITIYRMLLGILRRGRMRVKYVKELVCILGVCRRDGWSYTSNVVY